MDLGAELVQRVDRLAANRSNFEAQWQDLKELVRPGAKDFLGQTAPGEMNTRRIYDGTATWAAEQLAAALVSYITPPDDPWAYLDPLDPDLMDDEEALIWLENVSNQLNWIFSSPYSRFQQMIHEARLDLVVFGTSIIYQERVQGQRCPRFRTMPLADCYLESNDEGDIDALHRKVMWTTDQCRRYFPNDLPDKIAKEKDPFKQHKFYHCVFPRDRKFINGRFNTNMKYASVWVHCESKQIVRESGFTTFPYHINRWAKISDEDYGRSPAMSCLPDIRMLNAMSITVLKGAQKVVDPVLQVPNDGFMLPIRSSPGALIFKEPGTENIEPLQTNGRVDIGLDMMNQRREHIIKSFHVDWLQMEKKQERMTAFEVSDRRDEKLRNIAPMIGRTQSEELTGLIQRSFELAAQSGLLPDPPAKLRRRRLQVMYRSPASVALMGAKATQVSRALQDLTPVAQIRPEVLDSMDFDKTARMIMKARQVPLDLIKPMEVVMQDRQRAQQQQAMQGMAETGLAASQAIKNIAQAKAANA